MKSIRASEFVKYLGEVVYEVDDSFMGVPTVLRRDITSIKIDSVWDSWHNKLKFDDCGKTWFSDKGEAIRLMNRKRKKLGLKEINGVRGDYGITYEFEEVVE